MRRSCHFGGLLGLDRSLDGSSDPQNADALSPLSLDGGTDLTISLEEKAFSSF